MIFGNTGGDGSRAAHRLAEYIGYRGESVYQLVLVRGLEAVKEATFRSAVRHNVAVNRPQLHPAHEGRCGQYYCGGMTCPAAYRRRGQPKDVNLRATLCARRIEKPVRCP